MSSPRPSDLPKLSKLADLMILHQGDADLVQVLHYTMKITAATGGYYKELITIDHDECLELLLNTFGHDGPLNTPFELAHYAIRHRDSQSLNCLTVILAYASSKSIDMNSGHHGSTTVRTTSLLCLAASYSNSPCMKVLLEYGIKDNPKQYISAAQEACSSNSPECLTLLIKWGLVDVTSLNSSGEDCLTVAAKNGGHECLKLLLKMSFLRQRKLPIVFAVL